MARFEWIEYKENEEQKERVREEAQHCHEEYNEDHYLKLAEKAFEDGLLSNALKYFSRALNLNNKLKRAWIGQVLCLIGLGQYNEAVVWADKALDFCRDDAELLSAKAYALNRVGAKEEAIRQSDQSIEKGKVTWFVWIARGDIMLDTNCSDAEYCFLRAIELADENWLVYMMVGTSFLSVHNASKAQHYLQKALALSGNNPLLYFHLANAYYQSGNIERSKNCLKRAIELRPDFSEALVMMEKLSRKSIISKIFAYIGLKI